MVLRNQKIVLKNQKIVLKNQKIVLKNEKVSDRKNFCWKFCNFIV